MTHKILSEIWVFACTQPHIPFNNMYCINNNNNNILFDHSYLFFGAVHFGKKKTAMRRNIFPATISIFFAMNELWHVINHITKIIKINRKKNGVPSQKAPIWESFQIQIEIAKTNYIKQSWLWMRSLKFERLLFSHWTDFPTMRFKCHRRKCNLCGEYAPFWTMANE